MFNHGAMRWSKLMRFSVFVTHWWILIEFSHIRCLLCVLTILNTSRILVQGIFKMFLIRVPLIIVYKRNILLLELPSLVRLIEIMPSKRIYSRSVPWNCSNLVGYWKISLKVSERKWYSMMATVLMWKPWFCLTICQIFLPLTSFIVAWNKNSVAI